MNSGAIGLNGLYYSFLLKAAAPGSGSIQFDPTQGANQYAANETGFNFAPIADEWPLGVRHYLRRRPPPFPSPPPSPCSPSAASAWSLARRWRKRSAWAGEPHGRLIR